MSEECIHGLDPQTCSICLHQDDVPETFTATAKYEGRCFICDDLINVGDVITSNDAVHNGAWIHRECAP